MIDQYKTTLSTISSLYPLLGMAVTTHRNTRGNPLEFKNMPYLVEMYRDFPVHDDIVVRKAVQTGVSELCIQLALNKSGWDGRIVAYCLPTYSIRDRFVKNRIDPILATVPAYRNKCPGGKKSFESTGSAKSGNLKMKRFGDGRIMFLGSNTTGDFVEFSADTLIVDEFDQCDPANLTKAKDRLRASPFPQEVKLGNPTLPRVGISRLYNESDQRKFCFVCSHCNHWQKIDWFRNCIVKDNDGQWVPRDIRRSKYLFDSKAKKAMPQFDIRPICSRCEQPFVRNAERSSWIQTYPGRHCHGYTMSRLDVLSDSLWMIYCEWMLAQGSSDSLSSFYTSVLGIPFEFSGAKLTYALLGDCATGDALDYQGGDFYKDKIVTAGVDIGSVINITISTIEEGVEIGKPRRVARWVGAVRDFEAVREIFDRYYVTVAVVDVAPEMRKCQELRDWYKDHGGTLVYLCRFYPTPRVGAQRYGMKVDYQTSVVTVDRTAVFDATFEDMIEKRRTFPEDVFTVLGWSDQMRVPTRVLNEGKGRIVWESGAGADHYRLSDVYDRVACDMLEMGGSYSVI